MKLLEVVFSLLILQPFGCLASMKTTYVRTINISVSNWNARKTRTTPAKNILDCGYKCNYWKFQEDSCNSYSYNKELQQCELAYLDFLEDPDSGEEAKSILIEYDVVPTIPMYCRGGQGCCNREHLYGCGENEGDCDWDGDCEGSLICGTNNCLETRSPHSFYDEEDDCCERRCKPNHPCEEGEGHCEYDSDCGQPWLLCGDNNCKNTNYFPQEKFFWNYIVDIYSDTDNCCYKICRPEARCDLNVFGCLDDTDCLDGLYCDKNDYYCKDINECDISNGKIDGYIYCGRNVDCVNQNKYYDCNCKVGYQSFVAYEGCTDIDECATSTHNCDTVTEMCINTIGSFVCVCNDGYTGVEGSCVDVDECRMATHTCSPKTVLHAETSDEVGDVYQYHDYDFIDLGYTAHSLDFDVSSTATITLQLGSISTSYKLRISADTVQFFKAVNDAQVSVSKTINSAFSFPGRNYIHYWIDFRPSGTSMLIDVGAYNRDNVLLSYTDTKFSVDPIVVEVVGFKTATGGETFWRNFQIVPLAGASTCVNTIGSYICNPVTSSFFSSKLAIGAGGHTRYSGAEYFNELQVVTDKVTVCGSHTIPPLVGRPQYRGGMAEIDGWLYVCGGKKHTEKLPTAACYKYDLKSGSASWLSAPSLPKNMYINQMMVSFENSIYVMGGEYHYETVDSAGTIIHNTASLSTNYRFNHNTNSWVSMAGLWTALHRAGTCVDEEARRIWIFGGHSQHCCDRAKVLYYTVDKNSWTEHSNLPKVRPDSACGVVYTVLDSKMIMCVIAHEANSIYYWDFSTNTGWHHMGNLRHSYNHHYMSMVVMDKYNALLVGGYSQLNGVSTRNLWKFDQKYRRFEEKYYHLQNAAQGGVWTTVLQNKNYRALQNCQAETRTYAAVGWGGTTSDTNVYPTKWHVFLRSRNEGDPGRLTTCHGIIPDLTPGRNFAMVTAVGYNLIVCGGKNSLLGEEYSSCFKFETNKPFLEWQAMANMTDVRVAGKLVTYADAAYAIGGRQGEGSTNVLLDSVEKWTEATGWNNVAKLPKTMFHHCAVADDRYGNIFVGGGLKDVGVFNTDWYRYDVTNDAWSSINKPAYYGGYQCGLTIIEKRSSGRLQMIMVGNYHNVINWIDLTTLHNGGNPKWSYHTSAHHSEYTSLVSLSAHEALEFGGSTSRWGISASNAFYYAYDNYEYFEDIGMTLAHPSKGAGFTRVPDEAWVFRNCSIY